MKPILGFFHSLHPNLYIPDLLIEPPFHKNFKDSFRYNYIKKKNYKSIFCLESEHDETNFPTILQSM